MLCCKKLRHTLKICRSSCFIVDNSCRLSCKFKVVNTTIGKFFINKYIKSMMSIWHVACTTKTRLVVQWEWHNFRTGITRLTLIHFHNYLTNTNVDKSQTFCNVTWTYEGHFENSHIGLDLFAIKYLSDHFFQSKNINFDKMEVNNFKILLIDVTFYL